MSGLVKPEKKDGIWGLVGLLHVLDPDMVLRYHWLVQTLTPVKGSLVVDVDNVYSVSQCLGHKLFSQGFRTF